MRPLQNIVLFLAVAVFSTTSAKAGSYFPVDVECDSYYLTAQGNALNGPTLKKTRFQQRNTIGFWGKGPAQILFTLEDSGDTTLSVIDTSKSPADRLKAPASYARKSEMIGIDASVDALQSGVPSPAMFRAHCTITPVQK